MTRRITRVLIANRGEIAVRIIHACHDYGYTAIAIYADDDADALFVQLADEAYALRGHTPAQTYLNIRAIVDLARQSHADAIHPGYGFLSENADFAQAVIDAGFVWIGPTPATIRALGDKVQARTIASQVGAPMVPGTTSPVKDVSEVMAFAKKYGMPVVIKAVHGGGGRGLKVVRDADQIEEAFLSATHEAEVAFGNGDCFIERFLGTPRHVEVQVLGDTHGHVIAVGTRDCSLQRRNQKLIEEAPAPFLPAETTQRLEDAAVAICKRAGYVGAGTVEFLVDSDGAASFMEVNTRIQVEHPVTEAVTGSDLVREQLRIAEGGSIASLRPDCRGHAMEFRINAEDPEHGFVPFPGVISTLRIPSGPGIRWETGIAEGSKVPDQFDSMLAKLEVHADSRDACIVRARRALRELRIEGVPTVIPFDQAVLDDADFIDPHHLHVYTRWIEEVFLNRIDPERLRGASYGKRAGRNNVTRTWIEVGGKRVEVGIPASLALNFGGEVAHAGSNERRQATPESEHVITAITSGTVVRWLSDEGAHVTAGEPVVVVEAMKMEAPVSTPYSGVVHIRKKVGAAVESGDVLGDVNE